MKIGYLYRDNLVMSELRRGLEKTLAQHEFLPWKTGDPPPARDIEVLLAVGDVRRDVMEGLPSLALIQTTSAGYEGIDVDAATSLGIWVSFAPSGETGNATSVAEMAVLLMLAASRNLNRAFQSVRDRSFRPSRTNLALFGKTVCIVGLGAIGRVLAERLRPFGMKILAVDDRPEDAPDRIRGFPPDELKIAVSAADYVVVCVPATPKNAHIIDADVLAAMPEGSILVNIARGMLVDEDALRDAVASGHIYAAGLDVLKTEPPDPNDPLLTHPEIVVTPHIAGATDVMVAGTIAYLTRAIELVDAGTKPASLLNAPSHPRKLLRDDGAR